MTWNYRVIKKQSDDEAVFEIHEVHYTEDGVITLWSEKPVAPQGIGEIDDLGEDIMMQLAALFEPALTIEKQDGEDVLVASSSDSDNALLEKLARGLKEAIASTDRAIAAANERTKS